MVKKACCVNVFCAYFTVAVAVVNHSMALLLMQAWV